MGVFAEIAPAIPMEKSGNRSIIKVATEPLSHSIYHAAHGRRVIPAPVVF